MQSSILSVSHLCLLGNEPNQLPGGEKPLWHLWPGSIPKFRRFYLAIQPTGGVGSTDFPPRFSPGDKAFGLHVLGSVLSTTTLEVVPEQSGSSLVI